MNDLRGSICRGILTAPIAILLTFACGASAQNPLQISVNAQGEYVVGGTDHPVLVSGIAAKIDDHWVKSSDFPTHHVQKETVRGYWGAAEQWRVEFTGTAGKPDLIYRLRSYSSEPFADLQVTVRNNTSSAVTVQGLRSIDASGAGAVSLGGPSAADRVLSDSFSEDRPAMQIRDLGDAVDQMHRGVGSQLIYNRDSHESFFVGALTSERFLTILRLHTNGTNITRYEVDSTGTTEMELENSLEKAAGEDRVVLSLPVAPGGGLSSEAVAISVSPDYHHQLETYGALIRQIHHARVSAPPLLGWWSWTAYYFGLNEGAALTNAQWEAEHLKSFGYDVFHIDEGYAFARGEYATPDAVLFPHGLGPVEYQVRGLGLVPGVWVSPFQASERSFIYQQHPDWLVKNAQGKPIHAGFLVDGKDPLYVIDTTNPAAQDYLRATYRKLVDEWGIHYIKMDFMDDAAIEGYYYKPHTTAMEAQRIGLQLIRDTVGDDVYLDKDGSVMLNPVGYVDYGRISQDTGHSFEASRDAATGIAARYFMNRNYYVSDPDAFTVSTQRITDQSWHEGNAPLTLNEARVSMALAAVSGGMLEIGDNLPSLEGAPDRLALIENRDLIDMVRLGKASRPVDLMSYTKSDLQPSIFFLKESNRQSVLTVFNWSETPLTRNIRLSDLGLSAKGAYSIASVFDQKELEATGGALTLNQPAHSVEVLRMIDSSLPAAAPDITLHCPESATAGEEASVAAQETDAQPVVSWHWDFGDGVSLDGQARPSHTWTEPGDYEVKIRTVGLDGISSEKSCRIHVTGHLPTVFVPAAKKRLQGN